jgi:hypothetical protein
MEAKLTDKAAAEIADRAITRFRGDSRKLTNAIGLLFVGRRVGYRPLLLMTDKTTLRRYEDILGIKYQEVLPEVGPDPDKSMAWRAVANVSNFWKAVKGEIPGIRSTEMK